MIERQKEARVQSNEEITDKLLPEKREVWAESNPHHCLAYEVTIDIKMSHREMSD